MVLDGKDGGFSFECVNFEVIVVGDLNRVIEVVIAFIGYLGLFLVCRWYLRLWRMFEILGKVCRLRKGWVFDNSFFMGSLEKNLRKENF